MLAAVSHAAAGAESDLRTEFLRKIRIGFLVVIPVEDTVVGDEHALHRRLGVLLHRSAVRVHREREELLAGVGVAQVLQAGRHD